MTRTTQEVLRDADYAMSEWAAHNNQAAGQFLSDTVAELTALLRESEEKLAGLNTDEFKTTLDLSFYSAMCTWYGNDRDFEEELCKELAQAAIEDITQFKPTPPEKEGQGLTKAQQEACDRITQAQETYVTNSKIRRT